MRKQYHELDDEDLARICHEAHLALRIGLNDSADDAHFDALPQWRKDLVTGEVRMIREGRSHAEVHQAWADRLREQGWRWGIYRDVQLKQHPNLVPYDDLPVSEKAKVRQAFRIVLTHVMPEALEGIAYHDVRSRNWGEDPGLGYDLGSLVVCTTHRRFIPCRIEQGCIFSEAEEDIEEVSRYQNG